MDCESVEGSTENELTEDDGARRQFLPLESLRSKVWEHFGFLACDGKYCEPDKKKCKVVYCLVCNNGYKYCINASNMQFHLKHCHPLLFQALSEDGGSSNNGSNPSGSTSIPPGQQRLPELFRQQEPFYAV